MNFEHEKRDLSFSRCQNPDGYNHTSVNSGPLGSYDFVKTHGSEYNILLGNIIWSLLIACYMEMRLHLSF
jgi:hypothetical protein